LNSFSIDSISSLIISSYCLPSPTHLFATNAAMTSLQATSDYPHSAIDSYLTVVFTDSTLQ